MNISNAEALSSDSFPEAPPLIRIDSKISDIKVTEFLFPELEEHAHEIVQYAINMVGKLLLEFDKCRDKDFSKIRHIWNLLFYFTSDDKTETWNNCFRYFAVAVIYTQIMLESFKDSEEYKVALQLVKSNSASYENSGGLHHDTSMVKSSSPWRTPEDGNEMDIFDLDKIAERVVEELTKYSSVKQEIDEAVKSADHWVHQAIKAGSLASKECVGNTPYLVVYKGRSREVSIRRGFELYRPKDPESKKVTDVKMKLKNLPVRYYNNGEYYNKSDKPVSLFQLVGRNKDLAEQLFLGKHITAIHIYRIDSFRNIYNTKLQGI